MMIDGIDEFTEHRRVRLTQQLRELVWEDVRAPLKGCTATGLSHHSHFCLVVLRTHKPRNRVHGAHPLGVDRHVAFADLAPILQGYDPTVAFLAFGHTG